MNEQNLDAKKRAALKRARWKRRRAYQQLRFSLLSLMILIPCFLLITLFLLVFPRSTISEIENRTLATFPSFSFSSYFSGEFTEGIKTFYDDTVPYRDSFKRMGTQIQSTFGFRSSTDTITFINADLQEVEQADPEAGAAPETSAPAQEQNPAATPVPSQEPDPQKDFTAEDAEFDMANGLMVVCQDDHWRCMPLFGGGDDTNYVNALNTLRERVDKSVTIYSMPAPLSSEFYVPSNAASYSSSQSDRIDQIGEELADGIVNVNICDDLAKHTEEPIYLRTDHHWGPLGAYYAVQAFAEAANVPFADLSEYTEGCNEGYVGTMYAYSQDSRILNDPEDFIYYEPNCAYSTYYYDSNFKYQYEHSLFVDVDPSSSYLMFMGSDTFVVKINTKVNNGRKLLLIKDSYGNAEVPFFTSSFEQIYVTDMRYFNRNLVNFIDEMGITDVLFSMCTYSVVGTNAKGLMTLIEQDPDSEIIDEQLGEEPEPSPSPSPTTGTGTGSDGSTGTAGTAGTAGTGSGTSGGGGTGQDPGGGT